MMTKKPMAKKTMSKKAMPSVAIMIMPKMTKKEMKMHEGMKDMGKGKKKKDMS
jgi:hypothetical protein